MGSEGAKSPPPKLKLGPRTIFLAPALAISLPDVSTSYRYKENTMTYTVCLRAVHTLLSVVIFTISTKLYSQFQEKVKNH